MGTDDKGAMDMTDRLKLDDALYHYLSDRRIRQAVTNLVGDAELPLSDDWADIQQFYSARVMVHQVRAAHVEAFYTLWERIWAPVIDPRFQPMSPEDQAEYEWYGPCDEIFFTHECFGRGFRWKGQSRVHLFYAVQLSSKYGARVSYSMFNGDDCVQIDADGFELEHEDDNFEHWSRHAAPVAPELDLSGLATAAKVAQAAITAWKP